MSVYMVAFFDIKDIKEFTKKYVSPTIPIAIKHGGKVLCSASNDFVKEGKFPPGRSLIIEFPTMEAAEAFYSDPEYQPLIKMRETISSTVLGIFPSFS